VLELQPLHQLQKQFAAAKFLAFAKPDCLLMVLLAMPGAAFIATFFAIASMAAN
jgi:hypothetical protein